jgi:hypothetical protein
MKTLFVAVFAVIAALAAAGVWYVGQFGGEERLFGTPDRLTPYEAWHNADANSIVVDTPHGGMAVSNPFTVSGKARGNWYFEASFPLQVVDTDGTIILTMPVQAQRDWMTTEFVPFSGSVDVGNFKGPATVVFMKDNPSGLSENDASLSIPIYIQ